MTFAAAADALDDAYSIHAALDEAFGRRGETKYLWAMRPSLAGDAVVILVRTPQPPAGIEPMFAAPTYTPGDGDVIAYAVTACPTWKSEKTGQRRPYDRDNVGGRQRWFERRAQAAGLEIGELRLKAERRWISKEIEGRDRPFWIDATSYAGRGRVTDAKAFRAMLETGFGPRRAWGCGLFVATPAY